MKAMILIASITIPMLITVPAMASPAETPSPFMPPYPDYGLPTHCPCCDKAKFRRSAQPRPALRLTTYQHHQAP